MFDRTYNQKYRLIDRNKGTERSFKDKQSLLEVLSTGSQGSLSYYLSLCEERPEEHKRLSYADKMIQKYEFMYLKNMDFSGSDVDYQGNPKRYLLLDEFNRVIDARMYIDELVQIRENNFKVMQKRWELLSQKKYEHIRFRIDPIPHTGRHKYGSYYRVPKMTPALRLAADTEYGKYIRPRARYAGLTNWWDDYPRCISRSWKDCTKKRKQWM